MAIRGGAPASSGTVTSGAEASQRARDTAADDEPGLLFLAAAHLVLVLLGVIVGLFGTFFLSSGPRSGTALVLPLGLLVAVFGHPLAAWVGFRLTGTRAGTLTPLIGWSMVVLPLSSGTTEGDVILPGTLLSIAYLLLGVTGFLAVVLFTRPTRGRLAPRR